MTYIFIVRQIKDHIQCLTMYHLTEKHLDLVFFFSGDDGLEKKNDFLNFVTDTE